MDKACFYDWACFKAQQAAEYASKALLRALGKEGFGHQVTGLLKGLGAAEKLLNKVRKLDGHYLAVRYPDRWAEGVLFEYYIKQDAEEALKAAEEVLAWIRESYDFLKRGGLGGRRH